MRIVPANELNQRVQSMLERLVQDELSSLERCLIDHKVRNPHATVFTHKVMLPTPAVKTFIEAIRAARYNVICDASTRQGSTIKIVYP